LRLGSGDDDLGRLAAAKFEDQPRGDFEPRADKGRIDAALETVARIADDLQPAPGRGGADRVEQRSLDEHLGRRLCAAGRLAANDAAKALNSVLIGDRCDLRIEFVFAAVERQQLFAWTR